MTVEGKNKETDHDLVDNYADIKQGIFIFILVLILWAIFGFIAYKNIDGWPTRGQVGDMFGVVNSLFSGLAFAGLIYTIILQRNELALQRKELKETRTVFQEQSSLMKLQQKVNVFFQMLENHRGIIKSLNSRDSISSFSSSGNTSTPIQIEGYEVIEKKINESLSGLKILSQIILDRKGRVSNYYYYHPTKTLSTIHELDHIANSMLFIIDFIIDELDNVNVYHKIFYNALSKNEKVIFGIYFNFINPNAKEKIEKSNFNYFEEYTHKGFRPITSTDIPHLQIKLSANTFTDNEKIEPSSFPKVVVNNLTSFQTKVMTINSITEPNVVKEMFQATYNTDLPKNQPIELALAPYIVYLLNNDDNFNKILRKEIKQYRTPFEVTILYKEITYCVIAELTINLTKIQNKEVYSISIN